MLRVLLLIDDYNELLYLQTVLKKIGFDVEGLNSQKKYSDASLGFNPQILVATAKGKKVDAIALGENIRRHRGIPKLLALKQAGISLSEDEMDAAGVNLCLDSPVNIQKLVLGIAKLGGVDETSFLEKLEKISASKKAVSPEDLHELESLDGLDSQISDLAAQKDGQEIMGTDANFVKEKEEAEAAAKEAAKVETDEKGFPLETHPDYKVSKEANETRRSRTENFIKTMQKPESGQFDRDRILEFNKTIRERGAADDIDVIEDDRKNFVKALFNKD